MGEISNLNDFAKAIAEDEGLKTPLPIGQIKEVLRIICCYCFTHPMVIGMMLVAGSKQIFKRG